MSVRKAKTFPFVCGVRVAAKVNPFFGPGNAVVVVSVRRFSSRVEIPGRIDGSLGWDSQMEFRWFAAKSLIGALTLLGVCLFGIWKIRRELHSEQSVIYKLLY